MTDMSAAVANLCATAVAHARAVRQGSGPSGQAEFLAAVDRYVAVRSDVAAARDDFLTAYPNPEDLVAALRERQRANRTAGATRS